MRLRSEIRQHFFRFFEYEVVWDVVTYQEVDRFNLSKTLVNVTELLVIPTPLRQNVAYIQYYILLTNFVFMGVVPMAIMIIFNVLVVRAVNEANRKAS